MSLGFAAVLWGLLALGAALFRAIGAIQTAMAISYATIAVLGFASAFGLRVTVAKRRRALAMEHVAPA